MSQSRRDRETMPHIGISLQKEREKDKKRREQEITKQKVVEEPIFSQPRKVTTSRQDSLSRNIKKALGDPEALFREPNPNKWLGTSRSAPGPNAPATIQSQIDSKVSPTSNFNVVPPSSKSKPQKRASASSGDSGSQSSDMYSHGQRSRENPVNRSHSSQAKHLHESYNRNRNVEKNSSSLGSKSGRQSASPKSGANQQMLNHEAVVLDSDRSLDIPGRMSERDRVSSVDSDMLGGVENIFKEMVNLPPSLTEIKTPNEHNLMIQKRKITGPESSVESSTADVMDTGDASDLDSSAEDTEDDGEDEPQSWNLQDLRKESQSSAKPLFSTDVSSKTSDEDKNRSKNTAGEFRSTSQSTEKTVSSKNREDRFSPRHMNEHNRHQVQSRGRKADKKHSSAQRSASSGKRSQRGVTSTDQSRIPQLLNQTDPSISHTWSDSRHDTRQDGSSSQTMTSHISVQSSYRSSPIKGERGMKAQQGQNSPNLSDNQAKTSHVIKETISTTTATTENRQSVGRKGPSPRLSVNSTVKTSSEPSEFLNHYSNSEISDGDDEYLTEQKQNSDPSESDADSSSNSDDESSSSSGSESDNEEEDLQKEDAEFENLQTQASSPSWNLDNIREKAEQSLCNQPSHDSSKDIASRRVSQSSPSRISSPTTTYQSKVESNFVPASSDKSKQKIQNKSNAKKLGKKSAPSSLTVEPVFSRSPAASYEEVNDSNVSSASHNISWNAKTSTVENNNQKSSSKIKSRLLSRKNSPSETKHQVPNIRNTVSTERTGKSGKAAHHENRFSCKSLLVRINSSLLKSDIKPVSCATSYKSSQNTVSKRSRKNDQSTVSSATPQNVAKSPESSSSQYIIPQKRTLPTVSTGSETEQPIRRANCVEVALADSRDWTDSSTSVTKRKHNNFEQSSDEESKKRFKRDKNRQTSPRSTAPSPWAPTQSQHKSSPNNQWRDQQNAEFSHQQSGKQNQQNNHEYQNSRTNYSSSQAQRESPISNKSSNQQSTASSASFVLPDSSVPGEQERIETSDWYMREGKRMKHEGDGIVDSRTGRTRPGEALNRALAYFEASLFFIMSGYVMESENREDRLESSSNSSHSPNNMYHQTLPLLDFVLKMRPHGDQDSRIFKRIMISCIRCQAFLYFRLFKLKKDMASKYSDLLTDQFKTMNKSNRTPSPWHNANAAPNVLSPMSPAVPSPFGHGPSPVSSNGEQVTSSTQAGKMTPPSHANYSFPQKMYDIYRQHHTIMFNLLQAHEKWDQGESMLEGQSDFFRNIDTLCNRTLTFHTSLRDVFLYHKMVLHQLRTLTATSPRE